MFTSLRKCWKPALGLGVATVLAIAPAAKSAERLQFWVGPFEPIIWVDDLAAFAKDGTITDRFHIFARHLNDQQLQELSTFLNWQLDVPLTTVSQFTYWQVGERFLDRAGQVVQTDVLQNGSRPLRAALITAAADGTVTPLEIMQDFPLDTIQLNYGLLQQIIQENRQFFGSREAVMTQLRAIGTTEAADIPIPAQAEDPTTAGPYPWKIETLTFVNPLREGEIPFDLYLPQGTSAAKIPVVVISHGVASSRQAFGYLAQHLASHGYAVVVPQHDDDNQKYTQFLAGVDQPPNPITLVSRPRDISLALDELEKRAVQGSDYARLDLNNVGVFGHSLGGFTVLAAAGATFNFKKLQQNCPLAGRDRPSLNLSLLVQCDTLDLLPQAPFNLRDERIKAVIALNPPTSNFFGETGLAQITIPTLFIAGTADIVVPAIPEQIEPYQWLQTAHRYLVVIKNATHFTFLEGDLSGGAIPLPNTLLGPDPQRAQPNLKALSLAFFDRYLLNQTAEEGFLTQPYLDSLGTDPFQIAIVRELNPQNLED